MKIPNAKSQTPKNIQNPHRDHPRGNFGQSSLIAFHVARQQRQKRYEEMQQKHHHSHISPRATEPGLIKRNLFRLIAGPDNQQLRKREIRPKHVESKEQFAQVMQMTRLDNVRKGLAARK